MHPVLIELGDFPIHTYGAAGAVGFLLLVYLLLKDAKREGWSKDGVIDVIFWSAVAAILGARAFFVIQTPELWGNPLSWIDLRSGGSVFYGAPLVGLPVMVLVARRHKLPLARFADSVGRALPLGHALARLGCLGAGCCYGVPTTLPWAVRYTHPQSVGPADVAVHPVQAYEAAGLFLLSFLLTLRLANRRFDGEVLVLYLGGYGALRILTETFRGDAERGFFLEAQLGPLISTSQAIGGAMMLFAVIAWLIGSRQARR